MGDILSGPEDFNIVRGLVYVSSTFMSDNMLDSFAFNDYIEAQVKDVITDWSTIMAASGADQVRLKTGTACLLAMRITSRLRASPEYGAGFRIDEYVEERDEAKLDWDEIWDGLKDCAAEALGSISTVTRTRATLFLADGPTKSGTNVPPSWEAWIDKIIPPIMDWLEEDGEDDPVRP